MARESMCPFLIKYLLIEGLKGHIHDIICSKIANVLPKNNGENNVTKLDKQNP